MQATLSPASNDPHDVLEIAPDIVLVARAEEELSKLARETKARAPQSPQPNKPKPGPSFIEDSSVPPIDTAFRATAVNRNRPSGGVRAIRRFVGLLLAVCLGIAVLTLKVSGDVAQQVIAAWVPQFAAKTGLADTAVPPQEQSAAAAEQSAAAPQAATTAAAAVQASPPDSTVQANAAPAAATSGAAAQSPDQSQMMRSMAHHLESVGQEIEGLKAQIAELKASQEQMSRDMAKAAEQRDRTKLSALPRRPAVPPPRRPPPVFRPAPAAVAPMAPPPATAAVPPPQPAAPYAPPPAASPYTPPPQASTQVYDPNAPRPPMPVRE